MKDWYKAGEITKEAREFGKKLIKPGVSHLEVTEKIEKKILELGGELAFPVQISVNNSAAHFNALVNQDFKFKKGDVVKLDLGTSYNGAIGDTAVTIDLGNNKDLVNASLNALNAALKIAKPGVEIREIGKVIHEEITKLGFSPIKNLGGHGMEKYTVHTIPTIPNFDNGDTTKLEKGQVIAIEPFASNGYGIVMEGRGSEIYELQNVKSVRNEHARKILNYINEEFKTLPFSKRALLKKFNKLQVSLGLSNLIREGVIHEFAVLNEKDSNALISQHEHTLIVGEGITTG